uniref:Uncharacterized protein n=1 Tax=Paenibacillus polymyxa TaxID=1406 RepID=A0AAE9PRB3_PAEPO
MSCPDKKTCKKKTTIVCHPKEKKKKLLSFLDKKNRAKRKPQLFAIQKGKKETTSSSY